MRYEQWDEVEQSTEKHPDAQLWDYEELVEMEERNKAVLEVLEELYGDREISRFELMDFE